MFPLLWSSTLVALIVAIGWTAPAASPPQAAAALAPRTLFDDVQDPVERQQFRRVWDAADAAIQADLAARFVAAYPRSVVLREGYEIAAHASVRAGNAAAGLAWGRQALRLLPENVSLLVMVADLAATLRDPALAERSARSALRLLDTAVPPPPLAVEQWLTIRAGLQATAHAVLGRLAAEKGENATAELALLTALGLNPQDVEAIYLLGVVRLARHDPAAAAPPLAEATRTGGPVGDAARALLRGIYAQPQAPAHASFEAYVASLRWVPPAPPLPPPAPAPPAADAYAGSAACSACHPREHERWAATGMAKMLRAYRPENVIGDFSGAQIVDGRARAVLDRGRHYIDVRTGEGEAWTRHAVDFTIGSKWQQAYATRLADQRLQVFPIQFRKRDATWLNYWRAVDAPGSARADIAQFSQVPQDTVYQTTCAACHTSQLAVPPGSARAAAAAFHEGGINCEMCHGPSRAHAEAMGDGITTRGPAITPPVQFARITPAQSVAICAQCHAQSAMHEAGPSGAVNYAGGTPWFRTYPTHLLSSFPRTALYRDGRFRATTFISEAFARTQCFQAGGATCASCHNPHPENAASNPTSLKFGADSDRMCLQCHTPYSAAPERHTRHAAGSEASRCVSCHMPRNADALLFAARSHQIDEIPDLAMTARFGQTDSPNVCLTCHQDRGVDWLTGAMAARQTPTP